MLGRRGPEDDRPDPAEGSEIRGRIARWDQSSREHAHRHDVGAVSCQGLLAGLASIFYFAQSGAVGPFDGTEPVVKAFIAVVIGGLGSLTGAVVGGFVLGITEVLFDAVLPASADPFSTAFALLVVIGILLLRPQGLVGRPVGLT